MTHFFKGASISFPDHDISTSRRRRSRVGAGLSWLAEINTRRAPSGALHIACADPCAEARRRDVLRDEGHQLAAQGQWHRLSERLADCDAARDKTPGGKPKAELLAQGARRHLAPRLDRIQRRGPSARDAHLRALFARTVDDPMLAAVLAVAHVDAARAKTSRRLFRKRRAVLAARHFERAEALLRPHEARAIGAPLVAAATCGLLAGRVDARHRVVPDYETLIDLDMDNPAPMRSLGRQLLPTAFGARDTLEREAVRCAARTRARWGEGGYTWVMLDAIRIDDAACAALDVDFFIDGLRDILARDPSQTTVNLFAAALSTLRTDAPSPSPRADANRARIAACADWIVRDHLRELHPDVWLEERRGAAAGRLTPRQAEAERRAALDFLADHFTSEIAAGQQIRFTEQGPVSGPV
ncbi:hypothetical protein R5H30_05750 [Sulfitobacter sp. D35]|uniref:hypothetical protein n=1 Tax=Sulfitobacter sp. D35 TaxID=3083252 RepID=UPI00296E86B0|nr:hypothetical protein [Sulfitobacter sp. D35]MDW4497477.1 hypothetical protein [Sulfitobacter sp. D35]